MQMHNLSELLDRELRHLYSMESRLFVAFADLLREASSGTLRRLLARKRAVTAWQRERLRMVPRSNGLDLTGEAFPGLDALLRETAEFVRRVPDPATRDATIVAALRRLDVLERAYYESAIRHAERLGETTAVELLERNLDEETESSESLDQFERELEIEEESLRRSA